MVSAKLAREKPEAVKGLVRAITRAMKEVLADPNAAVTLLATIEPLLNKEIERRRLIYVTRTLIATPEAAALGVGDIDDERMAKAVKTIVDSYQLARTPEVKEVFNKGFLLPKQDRMLPAIAN